MRDFNFFKELTPKKKKKTSGSTYMVLVLILLIAGVGGATYYFYTELDELRSDVDRLESQLNDPEFNRQLEEAEQLREDLFSARDKRQQIGVIHERLERTRLIDNLLISEVSLAKPNTVALTTIDFSDQNVSLEGTSVDKDSLARFEHHLRNNDRFTGPFIPNIQKLSDDEYFFTLSFTVEMEELSDEAAEEVEDDGED